MPGRISVKCAVSGCHRHRRMSHEEREELRRVGAENHAAAGLVCPAHVRAAFNFELEGVDLDLPLEEYLVEAARETPRWRVMLTPLPAATRPGAPARLAPGSEGRGGGIAGGE